MEILEEQIKQWQKLTGEEKRNFYRKEIFDTVLENFINAYSGSEEKYKILISLIGFSPEPVIFTISALNPEYVYLLTTSETNEEVDFVLEKTGLKLSQCEKISIDGSDITDIYSKIKQIAEKRNSNEVAIDITGGKKIMGAGASIAGALMNCNMFYINYKKYLSDGRIPFPGTEYLYKIPNPHEVFGDLEMGRAIRLYKDGNYSAAIDIMAKLKTKIPDPRKIYILHEIFNMYHCWEEFLFQKALKHGEKAKQLIEQYMEMKEFSRYLDKHINVLTKIINEDKKWLILNFYYIAKAYAKRAKYDFAVLLLYRTLEQVFAFRLKDKYGINVSETKFKNELGLLMKYNKKVDEVYGRKANKPSNLPNKIGFMDGAIFLSIFNDPIVKDKIIKELKTQAEQRNRGILAHGTKANTASEFTTMESIFKGYIDNFISVYFKGSKLENFQEDFSRIPL